MDKDLYTDKPEIEPLESEPAPQDAVPFFRSWSRFYAVVLAELVLLIFLFTLFTKIFE